MDRQQICIIGGGETFNSDADFRKWLAGLELDYNRLFFGQDWRPWLAKQLPEYDVLQPQMPNKQNAKYADWAAYFSKILSFLRPSATLVGLSLGSIFLAKYFCEYPPTEKFARIILVAAPYDDETQGSLGDFKLTSAAKLAGAANEIHLFHSKDDPVVPFTELAKYQRDLPEAGVHVFEDKQHFNQPEFTELLELLGR